MDSGARPHRAESRAPAPTLTLTAPEKTGSSAAAASSASSGAATVVTASGNDALSIAALILAGFAALLSLLAVWLGRPRFGEWVTREVGD